MGPNMTNGVDDLILKLKRITNSYDLSDTEPGPRAPLVQLMYAASRGTFLSGTPAQLPLNISTCGLGVIMVTSLSAAVRSLDTFSLCAVNH